MTIEQFWHDDPKLIQVYYKAYMNKLHQEAHIFGYYNFVAMSTAISNAFRDKGKKAIPYMEKPLITTEDWNKKQITKENVNQEYRKGLRYQNNWVNNLSANK